MIALVRRPAISLADGMVTFIERSPIDLELARRQWAAYVGVLQQAGWQIVEVPPDDALPDSVFVEDTVVMFGDVAVLTNPNRPQRHPEIRDTATVVESLGIPLLRLEGPAAMDGGDVLKVGRTVYVGLTASTNQAAADQLTQWLTPRGWTVVAIPLTKALHLKSAVTALPDGTIIAYLPLVDEVERYPGFLAMPEEGGSHVVVIGQNAIVMSADAPESAALLRDRGIDVTEVDISEFTKLEGCVTCLSVRIRETPTRV